MYILWQSCQISRNSNIVSMGFSTVSLFVSFHCELMSKYAIKKKKIWLTLQIMYFGKEEYICVDIPISATRMSPLLLLLLLHQYSFY